MNRLQMHFACESIADALRKHVNRLQMHFNFDLTWGVGRGRGSNSNIADTVRSLFTQVLDFNSLYPTIIQEYNICFTTVQPGTQREDDAVSVVKHLILNPKP